MKIIGCTKGGWIVHLEDDEMAKLAGFYAIYADGAKDKIREGATLPIGKMYASATETLQAYGEIKKNMDASVKSIGRLLNLMNGRVQAHA